MDNEVMHLMKHINTDFEIYLKSQLKANNIPIKVQHADLFVILYRVEERIEFKDLVKAWNRSKSTLSETINRYVDSGVLKKETTPIDKRVVYISLTELGKNFSEEFLSIYRSYSNKILDSIDEEEKEVFKNTLMKVVDKFNNQ